MRIVLLITMGIERPSGTRYFNIARALVQRGHRVRILALHPDLANCAQRRFVRDGVEVWYVGQMHARKQANGPERFGPLALLHVLIGATLGMLWGIICSPADVYHLGKPQPINGVAALLGVRLLRRSTFYVDCDDDEVYANRFTAKWQRALFAFWQWLLPRFAAGVSVNTRFLEARMCAAGISNVAYVPNGIDLVRWTRPAPAALAGLRAALGLTQRRVIAYAGTLALHNHPVNLLLDAFAIVAPRFPDAALLLVGGGEDQEHIRQRAYTLGLQDRVYLTGTVDRRSVRGYLSLADLSADPVYDDDVARARSPLKIVESLALGVPVVTGAVGDRAAMVGAGGVLVAPGDATALAAGIIALLSDNTQRAQCATSALVQAGAYQWREQVQLWERLYSPTIE